MLTNIDLRSEVRRQIPILLEKLTDCPVFVAGNFEIYYIQIHIRSLFYFRFSSNSVTQSSMQAFWRTISAYFL